MDLSILIISYNTRDLTLDCLRSVFHRNCGLSYEVIVVDNASTDGSADGIAEHFPQVHLVRLESNAGFARANNLAARKASGEFLLLLNPDTVLLNDAPKQAVDLSRLRREIGIVGGRTFFPDGTLNYNCCHGRPTVWSMLCLGTGLAALFRRSRWLNPELLGRWPRDTVREVDAVSGCFLLIRRTLWEQLGGFDERFFMYGEDTDLCLRARRLGYGCAVCPDARLVHYGGASEKARPDKMVRLFRAKAQLIRRHWSRGAIPLGLASLRLWALTRVLALAALRLVAPRFEQSFRTWAEVWRRRDEFDLSQTSI